MKNVTYKILESEKYFEICIHISDALVSDSSQFSVTQFQPILKPQCKKLMRILSVENLGLSDVLKEKKSSIGVEKKERRRIRG